MNQNNMQAIFLERMGEPIKAFNFREIPIPVPADDEILIRVQYSGLNFADVMARRGMYKEAPPLPCVLGYDVVGIVAAKGRAVNQLHKGDQVVAMTRFGGYAAYAITKAQAAVKIPSGTAPADATALATQYCTAYYMAAEMVQLHTGDRVLIHAGAGGVGQALIQYARHKGCEIFSTAGSDKKIELLRSMGVQHPINYNATDFGKQIRNQTAGKGVDVIFDAIGGHSVKKGFKLLAAGGRLVCYGAASMNNQNMFGKIGSALGFGFYHPVMLMMPSKAIIGVNMLRIADEKPDVLARCLQAVVTLTESGIFKPTCPNILPATSIAAAHALLENRTSTGKVAIAW